MENVTLNGLAGADTINGGTFANALAINGGDGVDTITGGNGGDTINAGTDDVNDTINGGAGTDSLLYTGVTGALTVSLAVTAAQDTGAAGSLISRRWRGRRRRG